MSVPFIDLSFQYNPVKSSFLSKLEAIFNKYIGKIIHHKGDIAIIEAVGDHNQINSLLDELSKFGIKELVRTAKLAISN